MHMQKPAKFPPAISCPPSSCCYRDVELIVSNAKEFNIEGDPVYGFAKEIEKIFKKSEKERKKRRNL